MHVPSTFSALVLSALLLAGCGEKSTTDTGREATAPAGAGPTAAPATPAAPTAAASPKEMGQAAAKVYADTLRAVNEAMASKPPAPDLKAKLVALRDAAIPVLVDLGRKRQALDASGRAQMDSALMVGMNALPSKDFEAFSAGQREYAKADAELGNLISSFNVITQYANFDLLKKQLPEEAERLGIE